MLKRGIRGHDVRESTLESVCGKMKDIGLEYIQLVLEKSISGFGYGQYSEEYAKEIKRLLGDRKIAILGSYINASTPDDELLKYEIARFKEKILYAKTLNPIAVGTETGIYKEGLTHTEEAYLRLRDTIRELVKEGEKQGVNVAVEGVHLLVINTPTLMKRLADDMNSDYFKVIFDPVNYINIDNYQNQDDMICELFDTLHDKLVAIHVKDFVVEDGRMKSAKPGEGLLNFDLIFKKVKEYGLDIPFITEDISEETSVEVFKAFEEKYEAI